MIFRGSVSSRPNANAYNLPLVHVANNVHLYAIIKQMLHEGMLRVRLRLCNVHPVTGEVTILNAPVVGGPLVTIHETLSGVQVVRQAGGIWWISWPVEYTFSLNGIPRALLNTQRQHSVRYD